MEQTQQSNSSLQLRLPPEVADIRSFYALEALEVKDAASEVAAGEAIKTISGKIKIIKAKQEELFGPLKRAVREFEQKVKDSTLDPLTRIDKKIRASLGAYWDAQHAAKEAEEKKLREEKAAALREEARLQAEIAMDTGSETALETAQRKDKAAEKLETRPVEVSQTLRTSGFTAAQTRPWEWEIVDEKLIPREYLCVDEKKLNEAKRKYDKTPVEIPGVKFLQKSRPMIR